MAYQFLQPTITADANVALLQMPSQPGVYTASALSRDACDRLAATVLSGHEAGLSWESRTRYSAGDSAEWDVSEGFRRSRNISPAMPGLGEAYAALEQEALKSFSMLGLDGFACRLRGVDDQCLIYLPGDHIADHADDAVAYTTEEGETAWHVIMPQRHLVGVMWLTDQTDGVCGPLQFSGGELRFNSLLDEDTGEPLIVRPAAGKMVVFPASAWFRHEVLPVTSGVRLAITRWWEVVAQPVCA